MLEEKTELELELNYFNVNLKLEPITRLVDYL